MKREDLWWLLWGITIALGIQVIYDLIGEINLLLQIVAGVVILVILLIILILFNPKLKKKMSST
jgi:RsiW-degrading membrane proteinase PrsW (M82 family)